jgi:acyl-CoA synthetase (AMP-forming)/AMP-acid ligase II
MARMPDAPSTITWRAIGRSRPHQAIRRRPALTSARTHSAPQRTAIIMERFDAEEFLRLIERYRVTHTQLVPTMFVRLLKLPEAARRKYDLSSLRSAVHAAAPCPITVKRQMIDWWGPRRRERVKVTAERAG